ncbi:MAG: hypothetical protein WBF89_01825 [Steroidobacteraceae bacterium]
MKIFDKLNLKNLGQIVVLNPPKSFEPELAALDGVAVARSLRGLEQIAFSLAFVTAQKQVDALAEPLAKLAKGDPIIWFAYPKGTSKHYKSEINRDNGWQALKRSGFDTVRMVAIDDDWSALRFRRVQFIKPTRG